MTSDEYYNIPSGPPDKLKWKEKICKMCWPICSIMHENNIIQETKKDNFCTCNKMSDYFVIYTVCHTCETFNEEKMC